MARILNWLEYLWHLDWISISKDYVTLSKMKDRRSGDLMWIASC